MPQDPGPSFDVIVTVTTISIKVVTMTGFSKNCTASEAEAQVMQALEDDKKKQKAQWSQWSLALEAYLGRSESATAVRAIPRT